MWSYMQSVDFTFEIHLSWADKLAKNADPNKYSYSDYGIRFDARDTLWLYVGSAFGKNVIKFGVLKFDSSVYIDNKKKDTAILGKGPTGWIWWY